MVILLLDYGPKKTETGYTAASNKCNDPITVDCLPAFGLGSRP